MNTAREVFIVASVTLFVLLGAARPGNCDRITVDFEQFEGLNVKELPLPALIPQSARLYDQLLYSHGLIFTSGSPYVAVTDYYRCIPSGTKYISGSAPDGTLTWNSNCPITITFVKHGYPSVPNPTNFVSIQGDLCGDGNPITLKAYDVNGNLVASDTKPDSGAILQVSTTAKTIHQVQLFGHPYDHDGVGFDNLVFEGTIKPPTQYFLAVSSTEGGRVSDPPEGTNWYLPGTTVWVWADPDCGYEFKEWSGSSCPPPGNPTFITMDRDYGVEANFWWTVSDGMADMSRAARDAYNNVLRRDPWSIDKGDFDYIDWIDWRADQITGFNNEIMTLAHNLDRKIEDIGAYLLPFTAIANGYHNWSDEGQRYEDYKKEILKGVLAMPMMYWQDWEMDVDETLKNARDLAGGIVPVFSVTSIVKVSPGKMDPDLGPLTHTQRMAKCGQYCKTLGIERAGFFLYDRWTDDHFGYIDAFCAAGVKAAEIIIRTPDALDITDPCEYDDLLDDCCAHGVEAISIMVKHDGDRRIPSGTMLYQSTSPERQGSGSALTKGQVADFIKAARSRGLRVYAWVPMFNDEVLHKAKSGDYEKPDQDYRMYVKYDGDCAGGRPLPMPHWVSPVNENVRANLKEVVKEALGSPFEFDGLRIDHSRY